MAASLGLLHYRPALLFTSQIAARRIVAHASLFRGFRQSPVNRGKELTLHIGGGKGGLSFPATDDAETLEWQVGITNKETYNHLTLSLGDASITVYIHESLTQQ